MPCRVELTDSEVEAARRAKTDKEIAKVVKPLQERNDRLTHENDTLREVVLESLATGKMVNITDAQMVSITADQVAHRREDLRRLEQVFRDYLAEAFMSQGPDALFTQDFKDTAERLQKVLDADPNKPLEPQLGFDPDEY